MTLNLESVGKKSEPIEYSYSWKDVVLYALGVGANSEDLNFVYEQNLKIYPTFAVVPAYPAMAWAVMETNADLTMLLHAGQKIVLHHEVPTEGKLYTIAKIANIYDKVKHALIIVEAETRDEKATHLFDNVASLLVRGAGGFGGERGPKAENEPPGREPDFVDELKVSEVQNLIYRLSGDTNPLHVDPEFAKLAGFDRPILHGLCTFGFAGRSILRRVCDNDPLRLKSFEVRFSGIVFPGDTLTTQGWKVANKKYIVQTINQRNEVVLSNAMAELR